MINGQNFCTNKRECFDQLTNRTFDCPLWSAYCGPLYREEARLNASLANAVTDPSELKQSDLEKLDDPVKQTYIHLCNYFQHEDSVQLRMGIPGVSDIRPISGNQFELIT